MPPAHYTGLITDDEILVFRYLHLWVFGHQFLV